MVFKRRQTFKYEHRLFLKLSLFVIYSVCLFFCLLLYNWYLFGYKKNSAHYFSLRSIWRASKVVSHDNIKTLYVYKISWGWPVPSVEDVAVNRTFSLWNWSSRWDTYEVQGFLCASAFSLGDIQQTIQRKVPLHSSWKKKRLYMRP